MNFYKTSLLSGLYSVINLMTGIVITKITAQLLGPVGTAYIGKFANISGLILVFSTASLSVGIVKYCAQYKNDNSALIKLINTASGLILFGSLAGSLFVFLSYTYLNAQAFNGEDYTMVFILFSLFLLIISSQVLISGILNGLGEIKKLAISNIIAALLNLICTSYFIYEYRISGALFSNSLYGIFVSLTGLYMLKSLGLLKWEYFRPKIHREVATQLLKFGAYAAITSMSWMISMLFVREYVENHLSTTDAGLWQAMYSLSDRYLAVILNVMLIYFIPRLSEIEDKNELVHEMKTAFSRIIPAMLVLCLIVYLCKDLIISILLAESFIPMRDLFAFQMVGDFFRICASLMAYLIASKAMFRSGLKADLSFHLCLVLCSVVMVHSFGLIGASYAYAIAALFYFGIYSFVFKDLLTLIKKSVIPKPWLTKRNPD